MGIGLGYDRPREKLQHKGAAALTNGELLQILIGSGNAQASVARIARKALKQLEKHGSNISHELLLEVSGLGPARACQIVAAFELASRYPISQTQLTIDTSVKAKGLLIELTLSHTPKLVYLTLDGARRLIAKRAVRITDSTHPAELLRSMFSNVVLDQAAGVVIAIGYDKHTLHPSMFELTLARDVSGMAQLFNVTVHDLILGNKNASRSLKGGSW
jgi:DNA repair protein RadC